MLRRSAWRDSALRRGVRGILLAGIAVLFASSGALAAEVPTPSPHPPRNFDTYEPTARATRIDPSEAPTIDGDPSEPVWAKAQAIDEFYQVDPNPGEPGSQPTIARFLYDENNLYVAIYAYDSEPDKIIATVKARDGRLDTDDGVRIYLDPDLTHRNAYYFEMNALGARVDALIQNNATFIDTWNTIWDGKAKIQPNGFSVEMAIPFKDLSFDPNKGEWGLEIQRRVRRAGERIRWSNIRPGSYYADISSEGTLTGITGVSQGLGLDIQVYGKLAYKREWNAPESEALKFVMSGNAYYKVTPGLTGTLTLNPDFSNSPLDIRQINTTRFVLFQPETRDFFLQDAASFEFGGGGFLRGDGYNRDNGRPFFSRNFGLANGQPVTLTAGGKLSGEYDGIGIGALSVLTDGTGTSKNRQELSAARVIAPLFGESKAGFVFTNGDPTGASRNTVAGADFQYLDTNFLPGQIFSADAYYQRSFSNKAGDDDSFGAVLSYPNEPWRLVNHFKQIGTNFDPALGFVNRTGIRNYDGVILHRDRNLYGLRYLDIETNWNLTTSLNNHLESREDLIRVTATMPSTDEYRLLWADDFEDVPKVFKLGNKVPVPPGQYHWDNIGARIRSSDSRPYSVQTEVICCHFYNGDYWLIDTAFDLRPNETFQIGPHYIYTFIKLPTGSVGIHLATMDFIVNFTPDMQLFTQVQFDNVSQNFALAMRYRWEYKPGDELFISVGQAADIPGTTFKPNITQAVVRLGNTFRF